MRPIAPNMSSFPGQSPAQQVRGTWQPLFDTQRIAAGTITAGTEYRLFSQGLGANANGFTAKTAADTNLERSGGLSNARAYEALFFGIGVHCGAGTLTDAQLRAVASLLRETSVSFESSDYKQKLGPAVLHPAGVGVTIAVAGPGTGVAYEVNNGLPSAEAQKQWGESLVIQPGQSFNVVLRVERQVVIEVDTDLQAIFNGFMLTSVAQ